MIRSIAGLIVLLVVYAATQLSRRKKLQQLEKMIRDQRALTMLPIRYEPVDARWRPYLDGLDVPAGMTALGDFVEVPAGRSPAGAMRGITDAAGTTFGWIAKAGPQGIRVMMLVSASDTDSYVTVLSPASAGLAASPPFVHRERIAILLGPGAALTQHAKRVADVPGLRKVTTLEELQTALQQLRGKTMEWRTAQPPAALLDADLRSILGHRYDELGPRLASKLGPELPEAKVV